MDLQSKALEALVADLADARTEYRNRQRLQSVSLSAPTGSGKTVMATALVERILDGDADHAPAPQSSLLWLTDQPELNEQTRQKMLAGSTTLGPSRLTTIESSFDERVLPAGVVSFLNIQKLSSTAGLLTASEERRYLFWETVNNTVSERGADLPRPRRGAPWHAQHEGGAQDDRAASRPGWRHRLPRPARARPERDVGALPAGHRLHQPHDAGCDRPRR